MTLRGGRGGLVGGDKVGEGEEEGGGGLAAVGVARWD